MWYALSLTLSIPHTLSLSLWLSPFRLISLRSDRARDQGEKERARVPSSVAEIWSEKGRCEGWLLMEWDDGMGERWLGNRRMVTIWHGIPRWDMIWLSSKSSRFRLLSLLKRTYIFRLRSILDSSWIFLYFICHFKYDNEEMIMNKIMHMQNRGIKSAVELPSRRREEENLQILERH